MKNKRRIGGERLGEIAHHSLAVRIMLKDDCVAFIFIRKCFNFHESSFLRVDSDIEELSGSNS